MYFYTHLIEIESLLEKLSQLDLKDEHKVHLAELVDSTIHHSVLEMILSQLTDQDKHKFLLMVRKNPKDARIIEFLNTKIDKIEDSIKEVGEKIKQELDADINEAQENK